MTDQYGQDTFAHGDELKAFFRDERWRIIKLVQPQAKTETYKEMDEATWYKALRGEPVWEEAVRILDGIYGQAFSQPQDFLPAQPPDDAADLRDWLRDWATAKWWHEALDPKAELIGAGAFSNWLSGSKPMVAAKIAAYHERAWRWWVQAFIVCHAQHTVAQEIMELRMSADLHNGVFCYPGIQERIKPLVEAGVPEEEIKAEHQRLYRKAACFHRLVDMKGAQIKLIERYDEGYWKLVEADWLRTYEKDRLLEQVRHSPAPLEPFEPHEYEIESSLMWSVAEGDNLLRYVYWRPVKWLVRAKWVSGERVTEMVRLTVVKELVEDDQGPFKRVVRELVDGKFEDREIRYREEWVPSPYDSYEQMRDGLDVWEHRLRVKGMPKNTLLDRAPLGPH